MSAKIVNSCCVPDFFGYQGNRRRFWPFLKKIAAKFAVKLELALHSMASTLPKSPNAKIKLIELFQLKSLNQASRWRKRAGIVNINLEKCLFSKYSLHYIKIPIWTLLIRIFWCISNIFFSETGFMSVRAFVTKV